MKTNTLVTIVLTVPTLVLSSKTLFAADSQVGTLAPGAPGGTSNAVSSSGSKLADEQARLHKSAYELAAQGEHALSDRRYDDVESLIKKVLSLDPENPWAINMKTRLKEERHKSTKALSGTSGHLASGKPGSTTQKPLTGKPNDSNTADYPDEKTQAQILEDVVRHHSDPKQIEAELREKLKPYTGVEVLGVRDGLVFLQVAGPNGYEEEWSLPAPPGPEALRKK